MPARINRSMRPVRTFLLRPSHAGASAGEGDEEQLERRPNWVIRVPETRFACCARVRSSAVARAQPHVCIYIRVQYNVVRATKQARLPTPVWVYVDSGEREVAAHPHTCTHQPPRGCTELRSTCYESCIKLALTTSTYLLSLSHSLSPSIPLCLTFLFLLAEFLSASAMHTTRHGLYF